MAYILLRFLVDHGHVVAKGIVTTLNPAFDRARLCHGTLASLGLHDVPVGVGTDGGDKDGTHKASVFERWASTYMPSRHSESARAFETGSRLLCRLYREAPPKSLTLLVIASLKDAALFLRDHEAMFLEKTREVVIMGGVKAFELPKNGEAVLLEPDSAHNNQFDPDAANFFYRRCQEIGVRLVVVSRWAAYAAKVPRACYDDLASGGSFIGCRLRNAQRASIGDLWSRACAEGAARRGLPPRCDRKWFLNTFCGGAEAPGRGANDTIWDLVVGFMQYDSVALLAALPAIRNDYFNPTEVPGLAGVRNLVIGRTETDHNVPNSEALTSLLKRGFSMGLALTRACQIQFLFVVSPKWNKRADELVAFVIMGALRELGVMNCAGVLVADTGRGGGFQRASTLNSQQSNTHEFAVNEIKYIMREVGLGHVPVKSCDSDDAYHILAEFYEEAPPAGLTLVMESGLGAVAEFVKQSPAIFHERTQRVVLLGRSLSHSDFILKNQSCGSSDASQSPVAELLDCDLCTEAMSFLKASQDLLVPLVIVSRHFSRGLQVPTVVFDALAEHGGTLGSKVRDAQRASIHTLWNATDSTDTRKRWELPQECNREWFASTFCDGVVPEIGDYDMESVWNSAKQYVLYTPLLLMVVDPRIRERISHGTVVSVNKVDHVIIGTSAENAGGRDSNLVKRLLYHFLFSGVRLNSSEFSLSTPPSLPLGTPGGKNGETWSYQPGSETVKQLLDDAISARL
eukprot:TRINITY_DN55614_c0_g1_i1.p1 TRINITY_DN55614_c0_g1~~TRINITY_DN55614_c0_g1_i1.p1  ORF type:complete len:865 (+),score=115.17 TRINITY_DN55614_c0_g1_i1:370-2595(+)